MKFVLFFILMLVFLIYTMLTHESSYIFILLWPAINMISMAIAYFLNIPFVVMGKRKNGKTNFILIIINLPWLLLTWLIFRIQIMLSREDFKNHIEGTNIWLSRRPMGNDDLDQFDRVIDLTCEFPPDKVKNNYLCFPNLDGHILSNPPEEKDMPNNGSILIHCANGHGRSALFAAIILKQTGHSKSLEDALKTILKYRKLAKPNSSQKKWLLSKAFEDKSK